MWKAAKDVGRVDDPIPHDTSHARWHRDVLRAGNARAPFEAVRETERERAAVVTLPVHVADGNAAHRVAPALFDRAESSVDAGDVDPVGRRRQSREQGDERSGEQQLRRSAVLSHDDPFKRTQALSHTLRPRKSPAPQDPYPRRRRPPARPLLCRPLSNIPNHRRRQSCRGGRVL